MGKKRKRSNILPGNFMRRDGERIRQALNRYGAPEAGAVPVLGADAMAVLPPIPRLAQGAVLPANRPFLAVVGDQTQGTNVEAPLSVIREAVTASLGELLPAMTAGFEAVVAEQQSLRRTVEGIELGDTLIGQAAGRYQRKMNIIHGTEGQLT